MNDFLYTRSNQPNVEKCCRIDATIKISNMDLILSQVRHASLLSACCGGALLGIASHLAILRVVEIDWYYERLLKAYLAGHIMLLTWLTWYSSSGSFLYDIFRAVVISSSYNVALGTSIITYRLLFHRARKFPGPLICKITAWRNAYMAAQTLQQHIDLQNLHAEYGEFVRIGMSALPGRKGLDNFLRDLSFIAVRITADNLSD